MYPDENRIHFGIFIKEQIEFYVKKYHIQYEVLLVDGKKSKFNYIKSIFKINYSIYKNKYDLIHVHFGLSGMFLFFNPFIKIPVVVTLHGSDIQSYVQKEGLMQKITKKVVSRSDRTIILNDHMSIILEKYKHKLVKIPCGIDTTLFNTYRNNLDNESFVIGFPANRSRKVKNFPFFEKIIKILKSQGQRIKVIEFDGFTREEVVVNLCKLDCLLMTSFSEGSPQIIKEALACNVPIVSTNVGDVQLLLADVKNCSVINSFDTNLFVDKIKHLIYLNPSERNTNGLIKIKQLGLDQNTIVSILHELYANTLTKL